MLICPVCGAAKSLYIPVMTSISLYLGRIGKTVGASEIDRRHIYLPSEAEISTIVCNQCKTAFHADSNGFTCNINENLSIHFTPTIPDEDKRITVMGIRPGHRLIKMPYSTAKELASAIVNETVSIVVSLSSCTSIEVIVEDN